MVELCTRKPIRGRVLSVKMAGIMPRIIMLNVLLSVVLCLGGCQTAGSGLSETSVSSQNETATKNYSVAQNEATGSTGSGQATSGSVQDPQETKTAQEDKHRFVPERNFQVDKLQKVKLKVGKHEFNSWVMDTDAKRQEGMMFLKDSDFKENDSMIFVFMGEDERRFWMHNTLVDLDICYCDKNGKIVKTYTMAKLDETTDYSSKGGSMYVIELKAGILKKLGIVAGMKFEIPEDVVSKDD